MRRCKACDIHGTQQSTCLRYDFYSISVCALSLTYFPFYLYGPPATDSLLEGRTPHTVTPEMRSSRDHPAATHGLGTIHPQRDTSRPLRTVACIRPQRVNGSLCLPTGDGGWKCAAASHARKKGDGAEKSTWRITGFSTRIIPPLATSRLTTSLPSTNWANMPGLILEIHS